MPRIAMQIAANIQYHVGIREPGRRRRGFRTGLGRRSSRVSARGLGFGGRFGGGSAASGFGGSASPPRRAALPPAAPAAPVGIGRLGRRRLEPGRGLRPSDSAPEPVLISSPAVSTSTIGAVASAIGPDQHESDDERGQERNEELPRDGALRHAGRIADQRARRGRSARGGRAGCELLRVRRQRHPALALRRAAA